MDISGLANAALKTGQSATVLKGDAGTERPALPNGSKEPSKAELADMVAKANQAVSKSQSDLQFQMDSDLGRPIVKIIDRETQAVLRQIPTVEMVELSKAIDKMQGVLVSKTV
ncbi:MAG: flagellar protein FlaG [Limnobacter sp.]|nr:flagellar protein FlaG [Limnobacter sp.]